MDTNHHIFHREHCRRRREASAVTFENHNFLHHLATERIWERIDAMDRVFDTVIIVGAPDLTLRRHPKLNHCIFTDSAPSRLPDSNAGIVADEEFLPLLPKSCDAIISLLSLHNINDLPGTLIQMRRALKDDGLLLAITVGAQSLQELRTSFAQAELETTGGVSPHIAPFLEVRDAGGLLQRAGFHLPVVDNEKLTLSYETAFHLMNELKGAGESGVLCDTTKHFSTSHLFRHMAEYYHTHFSDDENRIICTAELLTLTAWTPHHSQQQPAQRGSGKTHLSAVFT